jgi:predicted transcriptional regulator
MNILKPCNNLYRINQYNSNTMTHSVNTTVTVQKQLFYIKEMVQDNKIQVFDYNRKMVLVIQGVPGLPLTIEHDLKNIVHEIEEMLEYRKTSNEVVDPNTVEKPTDRIIVGEDGLYFEGTRDQFRDCFFDNAHNDQIVYWAKNELGDNPPVWINGILIS